MRSAWVYGGSDATMQKEIMKGKHTIRQIQINLTRSGREEKKNKDIDANGPTIYSAASASASSFESEGLSAVKAYIYKHNAKCFFLTDLTGVLHV